MKKKEQLIEQQNIKRKSKLFLLFMILYVSIWFVAIVYVADWIWENAAIYQEEYDEAKANSKPEVFMNKLVREIDVMTLNKWLKEDGEYAISSYSNTDDYERYFGQLIGGKELFYEKTDTKNIYEIKTDDFTIAKVKIASDNTYNEYNFTGWRLVDADVMSYMFDTFNKTIVADKNYTVYVNGTEVTEEYLIKENVTVMGKYMTGITGELYGTDIYKIKGFLVEPYIYAVDKNGNRIENTSDELDMAEYINKDVLGIEATRRKRVEDTFFAYFEHMNKLRKYEEMKPYLVLGTGFYDLIESAQKSLEWVVPVKKITIEEQVIDEYEEYGDSYFSCNVYLNVLKDYGYTTKNEFFDAIVLFKKVNKEWYIDSFILN